MKVYIVLLKNGFLPQLDLFKVFRNHINERGKINIKPVSIVTLGRGGRAHTFSGVKGVKVNHRGDRPEGKGG